MKGIKIIVAALLIAGSATACAKKHADPAAEAHKPAEAAASAAPVAAAPAMKVKNQKVADLQAALNAHGAALTVDGVMGGATKKAVKDYQTANNLKATGHADKATLKSLGL